jgi:mevalonate kinase
VYGAPAIAIPLHDLRMEATFYPQEDARSAHQVYLDGKPAPRELLPLIDKAFSLLGIAPFPVVIRGSSQIMSGAGLGSSAALCIALLRGLCACAGLELATETLASFGNELERAFHGTPSGLDTAVVAFEKVICFQKREPQARNCFTSLPVRALAGGESWPFMLIDSLEHCPTYLMIERVRPFLMGRVGERRLSSFARVTAEVAAGFATAEVAAVASAMNEASQLLGECGVITPTMAGLIAAAREEGVLAAKPTGAGGGGHILLLLDPRAADCQHAALKARFPRHRMARVNIGGQRGGC